MRHWLPELAALPTAALQVQWATYKSRKVPLYPNCDVVSASPSFCEAKLRPVHVEMRAFSTSKRAPERVSAWDMSDSNSRTPVVEAQGRWYFKENIGMLYRLDNLDAQNMLSRKVPSASRILFHPDPQRSIWPPPLAF